MPIVRVTHWCNRPVDDDLMMGYTYSEDIYPYDFVIVLSALESFRPGENNVLEHACDEWHEVAPEDVPDKYYVALALLALTGA